MYISDFSSIKDQGGCDLICPLSSRQVKYLKTIMATVSSDAVVFFVNSYTVTSILIALDSPRESIFRIYATHFSLYFFIRLFSAIGYWIGAPEAKASFLTSNGVLQ